MSAARKQYLSWGRVQRFPHTGRRPTSLAALPRLLTESNSDSGGVLPFGMGRSYGDTCLNAGGTLIDMTALDRFIAFDAANGILRAESGVTLEGALAVAIPRGWILPSLPGTKYVTLGGAVANDVHGKNHHLTGSFGNSVTAMAVLRSDGSRTVCRPASNSELFSATVGGMGLTGLIEWVEIKLRRIGSAFLDAEHFQFHDLDSFYTLTEESRDWEYTVAWIDAQARGANCGRGIFSRARHRDDGRFEIHNRNPILSVPFSTPGFLMNRLSLSAFNALYYHRFLRPRVQRQEHYDSFLFPLDFLRNWNRLYGGAGFYQYQCVIPPEPARDTIAAMLGEISDSGQGSCLSVLKTFGDVPPCGMLSFPMAGTTLALDFRNRADVTLKLLSRLDRLVLDAGGRLYAAKDGRMSAELFRASYPRWQDFAAHKDPAFSSSFWRRVAEGKAS